MRTIKKYANRKLYDTQDKRYVTLDHLGKLIRNGEKIEVVDNPTGKDITASVVSQIIARNPSQQMDSISSRFLMDLLRKGGGTIADVAGKYTGIWQHLVRAADGEIDRLVSGWTGGRKMTADETAHIRNEIRDHSGKLKNHVSTHIDRRLKELVDTMNLATAEQVSDLHDQMQSLHAKVRRLEKQLQSWHPKR